MNRFSRVARIVLIALVVVLGGSGLENVPATLAAQAAAPPVIEVGAGPIGEPSLRLVGKLLYEPERIALFGYLTAATNLGPDLLFTGAPRDAAAARFTYTAEITVAEPATRGDVRSVVGDGELRVYFDDVGADWSDPASFADGEEVAALSLVLRETLQRQDPAVGVVVGDGQLTQERAGEFSLGDADLRFGNPGIASRLRYTGALMVGEGDSPGAAASFLGTITVTAREARPVRLGVSGEPTS